MLLSRLREELQSSRGLNGVCDLREDDYLPHALRLLDRVDPEPTLNASAEVVTFLADELLTFSEFKNIVSAMLAFKQEEWLCQTLIPIDTEPTPAAIQTLVQKLFAMIDQVLA